MEQTDLEQGFQGMVELVILIIVLALIYTFFLFRIRKVMLRKIKVFMQKNIDQNNVTPFIDLEKKELPATSKLQFLKLNADSHLLEASVARKKTVSNFKRKYYIRLLFDFFFLIIYFLIVYELADLFFNASQILMADADSIKVDLVSEPSNSFLVSELIRANELVNEVGMMIMLANFFLLSIKILIVWLLLRLMGSFYRFSAYKNRFSNVAKPLWNLVSYVFVSKLGYPLYFIFIILGLGIFIKAVSFYGYMPIDNLFTFLLIFVITIIVHLIMYKIIRVRSRNQSNLKLLILRVFGKHSISQNIFTKLAQFWKIFGSYFTVVDESFYEVYWKKKYNTNIGVYVFFSTAMLFSIVFIGNIINDDFESLYGAIVSLLAIFSLIYPLIYIYSNNSKKIRRDIINTDEKLDTRLKNLHHNPINFDHSFKEVPLLCYNNTWKMAVDRLSNFSDVILMDLRGFSETNKGCEYEVNFLFDHVHIEKILFITDSESIAIIEELLIEQWKMLLETSPNLKIDDPQLKIYITTNQKNTSKETQGILDTLLYYAIKNDE